MNPEEPPASLLPRRSWPWWKSTLLVVGIWTVVSLLSGLQTYYSWIDSNSVLATPGQVPDGAIWTDVLWAFRPSMTWALLTPGIWWLAKRYPPNLRRAFLVAHLVALLVCTGVQTFGRAAAMLISSTPATMVGWKPRLQTSLRTGFCTYAIVYVMTAGACVALVALRRLESERERSARLQIEAVRARLHSLQAQLQPHFLFNTLHAISSLVADSPTQAVNMIARLGELLRESLQRGDRGEVALQEELEFAERYLAIEQVRFGERLRVEWSIAPQARDVAVPPFFLQPLVENAVQHGISRSAQPGRINISAVLQEDGTWLRIEVANTGPADAGGVAQRAGGLGLSLTNLRARLGAIYGPGNHSVQLTRRPDAGGAQAVVVMPVRHAEETATPVPAWSAAAAPAPTEAARRPC